MIVLKRLSGELFGKETNLVKKIKEIDKDPKLRQLREKSKIWKNHEEKGRTWGAPDVCTPYAGRKNDIVVCWSSNLYQYDWNTKTWFGKDEEKVKKMIIRDLAIFLGYLKTPEKRKSHFKYPPSEKNAQDALIYGNYLLNLLKRKLC